MNSRMITRRRQATVRVSKETLEQAIREANAIAEQLMDKNPNDPTLDQIGDAAGRLAGVLKLTQQEMQADGAAGLEDYLDDAKMPGFANNIKKDVDFIAGLRSKLRPQAEAPMVAASNGSDGFITDRDEKGQPKAPELAEVPRVAAKKKKEAEEPAVPAAPAAAPAPAPAKVNPIDYIPTETLIKVIEDMPKEDDFAQNKAKQDALIELTNILKGRPVLPPEPPKGAEAAPAPAAPAPIAASLKVAEAEKEATSVTVGSPAQARHDQMLAADEKTAVAPPGWEGTVKEMKKEEDIDNPWALAWSMKNKGYTPHAASFLLKRKGASYLKAKFAADNAAYFTNEDTSKVEEGDVPEVAQAHGLVDDNTGIDRPKSDMPSKFAGEMSTSKALKAAEDAQEKLKALYLECKPLTEVNNAREVRNAVELVYGAYSAFDAAVKCFNKQQMQEEAEAKAQEIVEKKKKSSLGGLAIAAAE